METRARRGQKKSPEDANQVIQVSILRLQLILEFENLSHSLDTTFDEILVEELYPETV